MADSTLRKYIWLINTILDAGKLTFREISEKWDNSSLNYKGVELSKRTFHNHRMAILTELGLIFNALPREKTVSIISPIRMK